MSSPREIIVDNFAGGGGASTGIEMALGRPVDIAINHDAAAVAVHKANHPRTKHFCEDVFKVDPSVITGNRPVGLAWFSPDCKHFSKAKGGKPRSKKIRGLAWVMVKWAAIKKPRVMILENVEEFQTWGPLLANNTPCPKSKGKTFRKFISRLQDLGYAVEWRQLRACDYGAPTIRKRLFLIARCDGRPIVWPSPTHGDPSAAAFAERGIAPWRTAAECIDWSIPCHSIFLTKEEARAVGVNRPLAEATMRRLARGVFKFVITAKEPFIVNLTHQVTHQVTHQGSDRNEFEAKEGTPCPKCGREVFRSTIGVPFVQQSGHYKSNSGMTKGANEPLRTQTTKPEHALVLPFLTEHANASTQRNFDAKKPVRTQCAEVKGGHFAMVEAFLAKHYGGVTGSKCDAPIGTVTSVDHHSLVAANLTVQTTGHSGGKADEPLKTVATGGHHVLVASHLSKLYGTTTGQKTDDPLHTVTGSGNHIAEVRAFLMKYYGQGGQDQSISDPIHTIPTLDRFGLVTVHGQLYHISDICMRMLAPRELFRAQGFPDSYKIRINIERSGKLVPTSNEAQVRLCGNSVSPPVAEALVAVNVPEIAEWRNDESKTFKALLAKWNRSVSTGVTTPRIKTRCTPTRGLARGIPAKLPQTF